MLTAHLGCCVHPLIPYQGQLLRLDVVTLSLVIDSKLQAVLDRMLFVFLALYFYFMWAVLCLPGQGPVFTQTLWFTWMYHHSLGLQFASPAVNLKTSSFNVWWGCPQVCLLWFHWTDSVCAHQHTPPVRMKCHHCIKFGVYDPPLVSKLYHKSQCMSTTFKGQI